MILKLSLPLIILSLLSGCATLHAPAFDHGVIEPSRIFFLYAHPPSKNVSSYTHTPIEAEEDGDFCWSPGDFLVEDLYVSELENNLVACNKAPIAKPKVSDCHVDGGNAILFCTDGESWNALTFPQATGYPCARQPGFEALRNYRDGLLSGISSCTPSN